MFVIFLKWAKSAQSKSEADIRFSAGPPCDNRSARLDIDTPDAVAEIVVWTSGDYFAEIIDIASEQTLYEISGVLLPGQRFEEVFGLFFETLDIGLK